jgi:hypothetical protein
MAVVAPAGDYTKLEYAGLVKPPADGRRIVAIDADLDPPVGVCLRLADHADSPLHCSHELLDGDRIG